MSTEWRREKNREWRQKNKDKVAAYAKKHREARKKVKPLEEAATKAFWAEQEARQLADWEARFGKKGTNNGQT